MYQALTYRSFKRTNSLLASSSPRVASTSPGIRSPRIDEESLISQRIAEESLQAPPLLTDKKITSSSKAPFVVLGEFHPYLHKLESHYNIY
jgi:hypothetical protein